MPYCGPEVTTMTPTFHIVNRVRENDRSGPRQSRHSLQGLALRSLFPAAEARSPVERFECTTRPKHGSWLDLVESELGVLSSECLDPPGDGAHGDPGPFWMRCDDLSGADFGRRKQRCRAMPLVVVAPAGQ